MWLVDSVSLVDFYDGYLKALREQSTTLLLLALIRDADAPLFYEDLERYWSALDDVTGQHIVFAVAGPSASERMQTRSILLDPKLSHFSPQIAVARSREGQPVRNLRPGREPPYLQYVDASNDHAERLLPSMHRRQPRRARELAEANTSQISELAHHLSLREAQLPCLHLTFLGPAGNEAAILPLRGSPEFSIYTTCKDLVEYFGGFYPIANIERFKQQKESAERSVKSAIATRDSIQGKVASHIANPPSVSELRMVKIVDELRIAMASSPSSASDEIVDATVETVLYGLRSSARKKKIEARFAGLSEIGTPPNQINLLRELIDLRYRDEVNAGFQADLVCLHSRHNEVLAQRLDAAEVSVGDCQKRLAQVLAAQNDAIQAEEAGRSTFLKGAQKKFADLPRVTFGSDDRRKWRYFVSYPSQDRPAATQIFRLLETWGRTFMDQFCLLPGDQWRRTIPEVQSNSETSVLVMTHNTERAHFQVSEIHRAISLMRSSNHRIIPVYLAGDVRAEFGLEQIHSIRGRSAEQAIDRLSEHLEQLSRGAVTATVGIS